METLIELCFCLAAAFVIVCVIAGIEWIAGRVTKRGRRLI
jgi:heme/copper-type cytochrome/quinol oxidase subunit 4